LSRFPNTLAEAYDVIYGQIKSSDPVISTIAERTIKWLLGSQRQLTSHELICAVVFPEDEDSTDITEIKKEDLLGFLKHLVVLDPKIDTFRFVHLSVVEYFKGLPEFSPGECHSTILERCLETYTLQPLLEELRFYSACHFLDHLRLIQPWLPANSTERSKHITPLLERFLLQPSSKYLIWISDMERYTAETSEALGLTPSEICSRLEATYSDPQSPVFVVCAFSLLEVLGELVGIRSLVSRGFNWNLTNRKGVTPLAIALSKKDTATGKILLSLGADLNARGQGDVMGGTLLHTAVANDDLTVLDFLLSNKAELEARNLDDQTPLNLAAGQGDSNIVKSLLDAGAAVDARDLDGLTPLLVSVRKGHAAVASLLIERSADSEACDPRRGRTPLHWAAVNGSTAVINLLLLHKCKINAKDHQDSTPIILSLEHEHSDAASLLLGAGADLKIANNEEVTPLQAALQVENGPQISDYVAAPELSPPGFSMYSWTSFSPCGPNYQFYNSFIPEV
jgi:ankyrin repeat protein